MASEAQNRNAMRTAIKICNFTFAADPMRAVLIQICPLRVKTARNPSQNRKAGKTNAQQARPYQIASYANDGNNESYPKA
jgi:hypothetical protein